MRTWRNTGSGFFYGQLICAVLFLAPLSLFSQEAAIQLLFHQLDVEDGLSSQTDNYYVFHDAEQQIWISSTQGVNRYNGSHPISVDLPEVNVQSRFFEDQKRRVWFSSFEAIYYYDRYENTFTSFQIEDEDGILLTSNYQLLYYDPVLDELWLHIRSKNKLYCYHSGNKDLRSFDLTVQSLQYQIRKNNTDRAILLFDPLDHGLRVCSFPKDEKKSFSQDTILSAYAISALYFESDSILWLSAKQKLIRYHFPKRQIENIYSWPDRRLSTINGIVDPKDSTLILSTSQDGLYFIGKHDGKLIGRIHRYEDGRSEPLTESIDRIYLDPGNNLWVSSNGNGLFFANLGKRKFDLYLLQQPSKKDKNNRVRSITQNTRGEIYCLTENNIEILNSDGRLMPSISKPAIIPSKAKPFQILFDQQDHLWYSTNKGLYVRKANSKLFLPVLKKEGSAVNSNHLLLTADRQVLVSTRKDGLLTAHSNGASFYLDQPQGFSDSTGTYALTFEDARQRLYLSRDPKEILIYEYQQEEWPLLSRLPFNGFINAMAEDTSRNCIWIASNLGLYQIIEEGQTFSLQKDSLFPAYGIREIVLDNFSQLWIGTSNQGLYRYIPEQPIDSIRQYKVADGLQSLEFNFWAAQQIDNGHLAFGGSQGLNLFNPDEVEELQLRPNPTIIQLRINNESISTDWLAESAMESTNVAYLQALNLDYDQNDLFLQITAMEYSDPASINYAIKMIGNGDTIKRVGTKADIFQYPGIPPGQYTLYYNASNSDGIWFPEREKTLKITVKPPWWQTWWARLVGLGLFLILVLLYANYRIRQIQKESAHQQEVAEYKQLIAETETAVLRLQMNPHFIFNSMNSISSYIAQKDITTANEYLHRFAKLMRMILKFAAKPLIGVSEEIELLELYLQTEAMRFEKKFHYTIKLAENFDPEDHLIPTMILQPFVENAIWHGLLTKAGEGQIQIRFWTQAQQLMCSIEDNGIGRKAAKAKKYQHPFDHEPSALSITSKRLEFIPVKNDVKASFEIMDLFDANRQACGTRVVLQFPLF